MRPFLVLAALAIAACSDSPTGNSPFRTPLAVTSISQTASGTTPAPISIVPGTGSLTVSGAFGEPNGCPIQLAYEGYREKGVLVFGVYGVYSPGEACPVWPLSWDYQARVDSLPAATYTVKIEHYDIYHGQWNVVATEAVVVP